MVRLFERRGDASTCPAPSASRGEHAAGARGRFEVGFPWSIFRDRAGRAPRPGRRHTDRRLFQGRRYRPQRRLLFTIDARPYEIRLAQAKAQLETATARLALAERELNRAQVLVTKSFGTQETVDQRTAEQRSAQAAVDDAKAQIRDAEFDLEHCRITAPFTGRIGTHLVSVGNLIAGSRAATTPTTLLATLVSLDPIWLDFDMSESDFLAYSRDRLRAKGGAADKVEIALSDETRFLRKGALDFVDNALNRSSGTIH